MLKLQIKVIFSAISIGAFNQTLKDSGFDKDPVFYNNSNAADTKVVCAHSGPSNAFENGITCGPGLINAMDFTVNTNEDFILGEIVCSLKNLIRLNSLFLSENHCPIASASSNSNISVS